MMMMMMMMKTKGERVGRENEVEIMETVLARL